MGFIKDFGEDGCEDCRQRFVKEIREAVRARGFPCGESVENLDDLLAVCLNDKPSVWLKQHCFRF